MNRDTYRQRKINKQLRKADKLYFNKLRDVRTGDLRDYLPYVT